MMLRAAFLILLCTPAPAAEFNVDKDTAIIIWRCGKVALAAEVGERIDLPIKAKLPDQCLSIGRAIGEIPLNKDKE